MAQTQAQTQGSSHAEAIQVRVCPACHAEMKSTLFNGIEVDLCPASCGIWFDQGELSAVALSDTVDKIDAAFPGVFTPQAVRKSMDENPGRTCPKDATVLNRYEWNLGSGIVLDNCPTCKGLWLDAGELEGYAACVGKFREKPPELTPEMKARLDAIQLTKDVQFEAMLEKTAGMMTHYDLWLVDDLQRALMKLLIKTF